MSEMNGTSNGRSGARTLGAGILLALVVAGSGCASMTPGERDTARRTAVGGAAGAAGGAVIGAVAGNAGLGAAAGAGAGLLGGFIYDQWQKSESRGGSQQ